MKWDYKLLVIRDGLDPDKMIVDLAEAGKQEWEVVSLIRKFGVPSYLALLKRPSSESGTQKDSGI